jgi:hypothetical protein
VGEYIKMNLAEKEQGDVEWIGLARGNRGGLFVNEVMNFWVPLNAENFLSGCIMRGLSSNAQLHIVTRSFLVSWSVSQSVSQSVINPLFISC